MNAQNVLNMNNGSLHEPLEYHKGGDGGAGEARERERQKQLKIDNGVKAVNALFGTADRDAQYAGHKANVYGLNKTAIDKSYGDAQRNLTFSLARNGLSNSSVGADKKSDLLTNFNDNIQRANDMSDSAMNTLKTNDERTRQNMVGSVQSGLDQTQAVSSALNNMNLNYKSANQNNVAQNWDSMFDNWKTAKRNSAYASAMGGDDENQFGASFNNSDQV